MTNKIEVPRELLERICIPVCRESYPAIEELRALLAASEAPRQEPVVIDLDAVDWETIQQAADESSWMPNEYMRNDWVADVCNFLKYGRADLSAPLSPDHSGGGAGMVFPAYRIVNEGDSDADQNSDHGWNSALDKVKELNQ